MITWDSVFSFMRIRIRSKFGYSALALLCDKNPIQVDARIAKLLEMSADINTQDNIFKATPLMCAIQNKNIHRTKLLLDKGADIEKMDIRNETALFKAVTSDNLELIKLLVDKGANIEKINSYGQTVLFVSMSMKKISIAKLLISHGATLILLDTKEYLWYITFSTIFMTFQEQ